jgi:hypothetical protein
MRAVLLMLLLAAAPSAGAEIYRWVDERGTVHYSNEAPPPGVNAASVNVEADPRAPVTESAECYTAQCQRQRLEQRLARREQVAARLAAERGSPGARTPRGLDVRTYAAIRRGMTESELLEIAGEPDLLLWDSRTVKSYTYYPTATDPYTTTVTFLNGRVTEAERLRR